jgi:hypothetical protein
VKEIYWDSFLQKTEFQNDDRILHISHHFTSSPLIFPLLVRCIGQHALIVEEKARVEDDLKDLINDTLSIGERVSTIQRMFRTYGFLQPLQRESEEDD